LDYTAVSNVKKCLKGLRYEAVKATDFSVSIIKEVNPVSLYSLKSHQLHTGI